LVENAIKQGAIFDVYKSQGKILKKEIEEVKEIKEVKEKRVPGRGEELKNLSPILQEILSQTEKLVDGTLEKRVLY